MAIRLNGDLRTVSSNSSYFSVNRIALLAVMTAFVTVGRLVFALPVLPNIQPMTALLLIITLNIGVLDGLVVSVLSLLLTNMILGMGPWTMFQLIAFTVVILLTAVFKYFYTFGTFKNRIIFASWGFIMGFVYGLIMSVLSYYLYGMTNFMVYYINGLPFDFLHAIGNFLFFLILEPILVPIIRKKFGKTLL